METTNHLQVKYNHCFKKPALNDVGWGLVQLVVKFYDNNPEQGFKTGPSSECLLEFDTLYKPLCHHVRFIYLGLICLVLCCKLNQAISSFCINIYLKLISLIKGIPYVPHVYSVPCLNEEGRRDRL